MTVGALMGSPGGERAITSVSGTPAPSLRGRQRVGSAITQSPGTPAGRRAAGQDLDAAEARRSRSARAGQWPDGPYRDHAVPRLRGFEARGVEHAPSSRRHTRPRRMTKRGFGQSCGVTDRHGRPGRCEGGNVADDTRYEGRDAQENRRCWSTRGRSHTQTVRSGIIRRRPVDSSRALKNRKMMPNGSWGMAEQGGTRCRSRQQIRRSRGPPGVPLTPRETLTTCDAPSGRTGVLKSSGRKRSTRGNRSAYAAAGATDAECELAAP